MYSHIDYAYPWFLSYGHLTLAVIGLAVSALIYLRGWSRILLAISAAFTLWAGSAAALVLYGLNVNGPMDPPTENFLSAGTGRVLDMGAGTGRSSIMFLKARPNATLVALDLFTEQYEAHFGKGFSGQEKLLANLRAAGVDSRAAIQTGDMRKLPFPDASFDGILSCYAIDHLDREGVHSALSEAARVLKPGGEFLLVVIAKDAWLNYTFGPLLAHARMRSATTWPQMMQEAGLETVEQGRRPGTLYYVARKPTQNGP